MLNFALDLGWLPPGHAQVGVAKTKIQRPAQTHLARAYANSGHRTKSREEDARVEPMPCRIPKGHLQPERGKHRLGSEQWRAVARLTADNVDWRSRTLSYQRLKLGPESKPAVISIGERLEQILRQL